MTTSAGDLGPFTGLRLIHATPTVELFTGFERNGRRPVVLIALTEQAGRDPNWSAEFTDVVAKDATTLGPLDVPVHVSDLYGRRPWAASRIVPGRRGAERILAALPGAVPEGTDPSALLHRPPAPGPQPGPGPHGPGQQGAPGQQGGPQPGPQPGLPSHGGPGQQTGPQAHGASGPYGPPQGQQVFANPAGQRPFAPSAPPVTASAPPAQVSAPGYHPAPGPVEHDGHSADADGVPTAAIPIGGPEHGSSASSAPSSDTQLTEPIPAVTPPESPSATPTPSGTSSSADSQPTDTPQVADAPGTPDAPLVLGSPGGMGTPGGDIGRTDEARAEGAPKLGPLPPGARNPTVPIPHTPPPTSGAPATSGQPGSPSGHSAPGQSGGFPSSGAPGSAGGPGAHGQPGAPGGHATLSQPGGFPSSGGHGQAGQPGGIGAPNGPMAPGHQRPPGGPIGGNTGSFPRPQIPPQPEPRSGIRIVILAVVAIFSLCVLALCAVATVFFVSGNDDNENAKSSSSVPSATAPAAPSRDAEQPADESVPPFKKALPVIVTGSVYDAGEQTDLIQRENWPFAFRVPVGWLCDQAMVVEGSNNDGVECRPPGRTNNTAVRVGIRDCDEPCDRSAQEMLNADIGSGTLIEGDSTTSYAELANAKDNVYSLFVSHFFGAAAGEPIQWQVVVQGSSPHTDRAAIQKVANDIRTQTP